MVVCKQVLVVEDDKIVRELLSVALRRSGFEVSVADSAESAVQFLDKTFHAVVSDWEMGEHDGVWLLEQARRKNPEVRRVLISGGRPRMVDVGPSAAVQHYLPKPLELSELIKMLWA